MIRIENYLATPFSCSLDMCNVHKTSSKVYFYLDEIILCSFCCHIMLSSSAYMCVILETLTTLSRYFGVDIRSIQDYSLQFKDIEHCHAKIRYPNMHIILFI